LDAGWDLGVACGVGCTLTMLVGGVEWVGGVVGGHVDGVLVVFDLDIGIV
jgi:hypothetical protein